MRPLVVLGLRLAGLGAPAGSGRFGGARSAMVGLSAVVGTSLMLGVSAISRSELALNPEEFDTPGTKVLLASVVAVIVIPVLVLATTAGRLSASLRDRRLSNLRLLGLPPRSTRLVAAVETGTAAVVGSVLGLFVFLAARPGLAAWHPAGREWTAATLRPSLTDYVLAMLLVPLAVVAVSSLPQRMGAQDTMSTARQADQHRPRLWRLAPLLTGAALAMYVIVPASDTAAFDYSRMAPIMFAGMLLLGIGVVLAVPIFVRLVADLLVRRSDRPTLLIAGRRLQAQPAAMTRVVAGLLIGLFIVTGARALVVAFEQTQQYQSEARIETTGQVGSLQTSTDNAAAVEKEAAGADGVRATATLTRLWTGSCNRRASNCLQALVATCDELRLVVPSLDKCRDDRAQWLTSPATAPVPDPLPTRLDWYAARDQGEVFVASVLSPRAVLMDTGSYELVAGVDHVFLPESLLALGPDGPITAVEVVVVAEPGLEVQDIVMRLMDSGLVVSAMSPGTSYYDFVSGLRTLVWAIAAIILSVGLLSFTIAAVDRGVARRQEMMSLLLAGVSARVLRRTQWIEASLPLAGGTVLAIGFGFLAGTSYLAYGALLDQMPWRQTLTLAGISVASACVVATVTVIASSPRIRPELIRSE